MAQLGTGGLVSEDELRAKARTTLDRHWVGAGYAAPNATVYPWLWLWDSCFHALIWAELGDDRATVELASVLAAQDDESGFVPHMSYLLDPGASVDFWGRRGASSITQPPMYGHAVAELARRGLDVPDEVVDRAARGLRFLLDRRQRSAGGLIELCHPWESGCDDSPRWDDLCPGGWEVTRWRARKGELVRSVEASSSGAPLRNPSFRVASVGFNALVAFNATELAEVTGDGLLLAAALEVGEALDARWDDELTTWVDDGVASGGSGRVRVSDALLGLLVTERSERVAAVAAALVDLGAHGAPFGPWHVHAAEPARMPTTYWRGPTWPQLDYLLWLAVRRHGAVGEPAAGTIAATTRAGAVASGFAEYWNPDTATGLGAIPQSWTGITLLMTAS